jgi:hypothetical protein
VTFEAGRHTGVHAGRALYGAGYRPLRPTN